jgi:hypothetical protein
MYRRDARGVLIFCLNLIQLTDMDGPRECEACGSVFLKNKVRRQKCSRGKGEWSKKLTGKCSNTVFSVIPCNNSEIAETNYIHHQERKCMMKVEWLELHRTAHLPGTEKRTTLTL